MAMVLLTTPLALFPDRPSRLLKGRRHALMVWITTLPIGHEGRAGMGADANQRQSCRKAGPSRFAVDGGRQSSGGEGVLFRKILNDLDKARLFLKYEGM